MRLWLLQTPSLYIGGLAVAGPQKSISAEAAKAKYVISSLQPHY
jgi:hypothetical protein